jgi:hypothetical protein
MADECAQTSGNQLQQQHTDSELRRHNRPAPVPEREGRQQVQQEPRDKGCQAYGDCMEYRGTECTEAGEEAARHEPDTNGDEAPPRVGRRGLLLEQASAEQRESNEGGDGSRNQPAGDDLYDRNVLQVLSMHDVSVTRPLKQLEDELVVRLEGSSVMRCEAQLDDGAAVL